MKHAIGISEAFEVVNTSPNRKQNESHSRKPKCRGNLDKCGLSSPNPDKTRSGKSGSLRTALSCPHKTCTDKSFCPWFVECTDTKDEEKSKYPSDIGVAKARTGSSIYTRSRLRVGSKRTGSTEKSLSKPRMGRMLENKLKSERVISSILRLPPRSPTATLQFP